MKGIIVCCVLCKNYPSIHYESIYPSIHPSFVTPSSIHPSLSCLRLAFPHHHWFMTSFPWPQLHIGCLKALRWHSRLECKWHLAQQQEWKKKTCGTNSFFPCRSIFRGFMDRSVLSLSVFLLLKQVHKCFSASQRVCELRESVWGRGIY